LKTCSKCGVERALSEFRKDRRQCRACRAAYGAAHYAANPEKKAAYHAAWRAAHPEAQRAYRAAHREETAAHQRMRKYNLPPADYAEILEHQGGLCAGGCGMPATKVDHCHDCEDIDRRGSVRGLLCHPCNANLDHIARFSPVHAAYLAAHSATCPAFAVAAA
jgi:hypothetical protein